MTTIKTTRSPLRVESENETNKRKQKTELIETGGPFLGVGHDVGRAKWVKVVKVQASSYKASPGCVTCSPVTIVNNTRCIFESC